MARPGNPQRVPVAPAPDSALSGHTAWLCALIPLAILLVYWPALHGGFIWDDDGHVTRADLRSLGGLGRIWFEIGATQQYYPLLHSAFWFEHRLWGDSPLGYHVVNLLLHAGAACLFWRVLVRLAVPGAWLAAGLFALHPVCVESVAWISEQKNTLSAVFYLLGMLAYLRFDEQRRPASYAAASGWFLCALFTKTVTATLPAALLVLLWWRRGRLQWGRDVLPLLPWFVSGAAAGLFTAHFERNLIGAQGREFALGPLESCLLAGRVFWFYLGKLAWPADLVFIYPRWKVDAAAVGQWLYPVAALGLLGVLAWRRHRTRAPLAAVLLFGGTLFPVLGFFNIFPFLFSYVADHFQYLACLPILALGAAGLWQATGRLPVPGRSLVIASLLVGLGWLSWSQAGMYRDLTTLYRTTIERNPACWLAYHNLAIVRIDSGHEAEALPLLDKALELHPDYAIAENSLGEALRRLGRPQEAVAHFAKAVRLEPRDARAHVNLGIALRESGRHQASLAEFARALQLRPDDPVAERNLGLVLTWLDRTAEALPHLERAVRLRPDYAEAELDWGIALTLSAGVSAGRPHFEKAIALDPRNIDHRGTYVRALLHAGRAGDAAAQLQAMVELSPDNVQARLDLAAVLRQLGRSGEAATHEQTAARLRAAEAGQKP